MKGAGLFPVTENRILRWNSRPEYDANPSEEYKELLQLISLNEEKLLVTMTDAQKDLFSRYQDCVREFQAMAKCLLFQNSFRLGARIMLDVMQPE